MARFYCEIDGFENNWIEIKSVWNRAEEKKLLQVMEPELYFELLRDKSEACHIELPDGTVITDVNELTEDALGDDIDLRLWGFVVGVLFRAREHLRNLGNMSARLSSNTNAVS